MSVLSSWRDHGLERPLTLGASQQTISWRLPPISNLLTPTSTHLPTPLHPLQALRYSRAAAIVRGSAFKLDESMSVNDLRALPFLGGVTAEQVHDLIETGSTPVWDLFR